MQRFRFGFALPFSLPLRFLGINPRSAVVEVGDEHLEVDFGPWRLATALSNVEQVDVTGPYNLLKAYGVRVSLSDLGVTFGTNADRGVCVRFREPVAAAVPGGLVRHPSMTVTVDDPEGLVRALRRGARPPRRLLDAVEAVDVPDRPVQEPEEDRRARESAVRAARRGARRRAEAREQERAAKERTAQKRAATRRATARRTAKETVTEPVTSPAKKTAEKTAKKTTGTARRTVTSSASPARRTGAAKKTASRRPAAQRTPAPRASAPAGRDTR